MKFKKFTALLLVASMVVMNGCGKATDTSEADQALKSIDGNQEATDISNPNEGKGSALLDSFINGEAEAMRMNSDYKFKITDLQMDTDDWDSYHIGGYRDLDNDMEDELILDGPFGGMYLDDIDGNIKIFAEGEGAMGELSYVQYDGAMWIVHSDTTHAGRTLYNFKRYRGGDTVVDEFDLNAEYYDKEDDKYDETSTFTYRGANIPMETYEKIRMDILGY